MHKEPTLFCRVCGLNQGKPQYSDTGDCPTYNYCTCCGVQFGCGDTTPDNCKAVRQSWINDGMKWDAPELKPIDWCWETQQIQIPLDFQEDS